MVIREESNHLLMVTQPAHAWISGQIAEKQTATLDNMPAVTGTVSLNLSKTGQDPCTYTLSPWPFMTDRVRLRCDVIRLEDRCSGQQELDRSLEQSRRELFTAELVA